MFNKDEIKTFVIKLGKKYLFPDFSNKLTWFIASTGVGIVIMPVPIKLMIMNWLIEIFNINSGVKFTLPELDSGADYKWGTFIIFIALLHNIAYKYFTLKNEQFEYKINRELKISDQNLFEKFLKILPSNCPSLVLLKSHDFGGQFRNQELEQIEKFVQEWNTSEYKFINQQIEKKKTEFYTKCKEFINKILENTHLNNSGNMLTLIPRNIDPEYELTESLKEKIDEFNKDATDLYKMHQELILFVKNNV